MSRRTKLLVAAWVAGLLGAAAWVPWTLGVQRQLAAFADPPGWPWGSIVWTVALAIGAGAFVGSRDRQGLTRGAVVGGLAAGLAWALGAYPPLAIEGQWAVWMCIPGREYGDRVLATALADTVPRTALYTVGTSWIALLAGSLAGIVGAALRPSEPPEPLHPPLLIPVVVGLVTPVATWLAFTLSAQLLPGLEKATIEPLFEVDRFALLAAAGLAAFAGLLLGTGTMSIWRRAAPKWKVGAGWLATVGLLLALAPLVTTFTAPDYAWLRQWYVYAFASPVGFTLGLAIGKKGVRKPPTFRDLAHEVGLLTALGPWLLLGPCGMGAGLAMASGISPIVPYVLDAQGDPDPVGFAATMLYAGLATVPWVAGGSVVLGLLFGGPLLLLLREPGDKLGA